jgi:hypothetical protein
MAVTPCPVFDSDCDDYADVPPTAHQGPANTNLSFDNCIGTYNPTQDNTFDGDFIDLSPPKAFDDRTWPNSDAMGDGCFAETDSDNDGWADSTELSGISCGGTQTSIALRDTDGDLFHDRIECTLGFDPTSVLSKPLASACGLAADSDGDKIADRFEACFYFTDPNDSDTDNDGCSDGKEVASINADRSVNSSDLGQIAQHFGPYALPAPAVNADFDMNKDGNINSSDLGFVAQNFGAC